MKECLACQALDQDNWYKIHFATYHENGLSTSHPLFLLNPSDDVSQKPLFWVTHPSNKYMSFPLFSRSHTLSFILFVTIEAIRNSFVVFWITHLVGCCIHFEVDSLKRFWNIFVAGHFEIDVWRSLLDLKIINSERNGRHWEAGRSWKESRLEKQKRD